MPSLTVHVYQNLLKCRRLWSRKQNVRWHQIQMRENGSSLNFNFILLPNPAVDKNWVCQHCLLIMPRTMFRSIHTLYKRHIYWTFPLFCVRRDFRFTIFVWSLYRLWTPSVSLCAPIPRWCCRLRIFHITDSKYVMFHIGWRKSLKGSATLDILYLTQPIKIWCIACFFANHYEPQQK